MHLQEQQSRSFNICLAIIKIYTEGKSSPGSLHLNPVLKASTELRHTQKYIPHPIPYIMDYIPALFCPLFLWSGYLITNFQSHHFRLAMWLYKSTTSFACWAWGNIEWLQHDFRNCPCQQPHPHIIYMYKNCSGTISCIFGIFGRGR